MVRGERDRTQRDMKVTLLQSDESAGTPESVQLLFGVFGEASNCSMRLLRR